MQTRNQLIEIYHNKFKGMSLADRINIHERIDYVVYEFYQENNNHPYIDTVYDYIENHRSTLTDIVLAAENVTAVVEKPKFKPNMYQFYQPRSLDNSTGSSCELQIINVKHKQSQ